MRVVGITCTGGVRVMIEGYGIGGDYGSGDK